MTLEEHVVTVAKEAAQSAQTEFLKSLLDTLKGIESNLGRLVEAAVNPVLHVPAGAVLMEDVERLKVEGVVTVPPAAPAKRGPGRPRKNPAPAAEPTKPELTVVKSEEPAPAEDPLVETPEPAKPSYTPPVPCKGCGVDTNIDGVLHSKACSEVKGGGEVPGPAPEPKKEEPQAEQPSFEKLREAAVRYAQKHGKPKLLETVAPLMPAGTTEPRLTLIADRAAAIKLLQTGMVA